MSWGNEEKRIFVGLARRDYILMEEADGSYLADWTDAGTWLNGLHDRRVRVTVEVLEEL